jgi:hypothetical protein
VNIIVEQVHSMRANVRLALPETISQGLPVALAAGAMALDHCNSKRGRFGPTS